ncbi:MAG: hypothetical protein FWE49_02530 [Synergistaceae bacterium]|nr:hypothetical protein [Synergistaceae bacterium]
MKRDVFKKSALDAIRDSLIPVIFTIAVIVMIVVGLRKTEISSRAEGLRLLEESVMRAAVQCYAVEGRYPDSIEYIEKHYGIFIDRESYIVHYQVFASNLLPDITVMELNLEGRR